MRKTLTTLAAAGSAALLIGALGFQHIGGLAPCDLCIQQRWPHLAAVVIGVIAFFVPARALVWLGALAAAASGVLGVYHAGVELAWWEGPSTCTSGSVANLTPEQLMEQIMAAPLIRCDEIAWSMMGLSMASWNAILSFALAALWVMAARARD